MSRRIGRGRAVRQPRDQPVPHHPAAGGEAGQPVAIADADLLHDEKIAHWQQWLRHAGIFKPDAPKGPIFQDFNLLATAAIAGHGVALCPVQVCRRAIENGDLIVLSSVPVLEDESCFMTSKALRSASATAFCDWFLKLVRSEIATVAC